MKIEKNIPKIINLPPIPEEISKMIIIHNVLSNDSSHIIEKMRSDFLLIENLLEKYSKRSGISIQKSESDEIKNSKEYNFSRIPHQLVFIKIKYEKLIIKYKKIKRNINANIYTTLSLLLLFF